MLYDLGDNSDEGGEGEGIDPHRELVQGPHRVIRPAPARRLERIEESSMARHVATDAAMEVYGDAVEIHGGYGHLEGYPVEK